MELQPNRRFREDVISGLPLAFLIIGGWILILNTISLIFGKFITDVIFKDEDYSTLATFFIFNISFVLMIAGPVVSTVWIRNKGHIASRILLSLTLLGILWIFSSLLAIFIGIIFMKNIQDLVLIRSAPYYDIFNSFMLFQGLITFGGYAFYIVVHLFILKGE
jgi:hypothetical protein